MVEQKRDQFDRLNALMAQVKDEVASISTQVVQNSA